MKDELRAQELEAQMRSQRRTLRKTGAVREAEVHRLDAVSTASGLEQGVMLAAQLGKADACSRNTAGGNLKQIMARVMQDARFLPHAIDVLCPFITARSVHQDGHESGLRSSRVCERS